MKLYAINVHSIGYNLLGWSTKVAILSCDFSLGILQGPLYLTLTHPNKRLRTQSPGTLPQAVSQNTEAAQAAIHHHVAEDHAMNQLDPLPPTHSSPLLPLPPLPLSLPPPQNIEFIHAPDEVIMVNQDNQQVEENQPQRIYQRA